MTDLLTRLTLDEAFRAAFFMINQYVTLERDPDTGLVLLEQYLHSDPARWEDWKRAVARALETDGAVDPLSQNLYRTD